MPEEQGIVHKFHDTQHYSLEQEHQEPEDKL